MIVERAPVNSPGTAGMACAIPRRCARMVFDHTMTSFVVGTAGTSAAGCGVSFVVIQALISGSSRSLMSSSTFAGGGGATASAPAQA